MFVTIIALTITFPPMGMNVSPSTGKYSPVIDIIRGAGSRGVVLASFEYTVLLNRVREAPVSINAGTLLPERLSCTQGRSLPGPSAEPASSFLAALVVVAAAVAAAAWSAAGQHQNLALPSFSSGQHTWLKPAALELHSLYDIHFSYALPFDI